MFPSAVQNVSNAQVISKIGSGDDKRSQWLTRKYHERNGVYCLFGSVVTPVQYLL